MAYILTAQLHDVETGDTAFRRYQSYLAEVRDRMPPGALALATSYWYFNSSDHRCPHDGWLESAVMSEVMADDTGQRTLGLIIRLFGAYHDGYLTLRYHDVSRYHLDCQPMGNDNGFGHRDWRYDEFRATQDGRVEHEIEWWGFHQTGSWLIEAGDIAAEWVPVTPGHVAGTVPSDTEAADPMQVTEGARSEAQGPREQYPSSLRALRGARGRPSG